MTYEQKLKRPLSPHLQIYKPQITSVLSITHRLTGCFLSLAPVALVGWLYALSQGPESFSCIQTFFASFWGRLLTWAWCVSFFYHFSNGIRHLVWDAGAGYDIPSVNRSGWSVVILTGILSFLAFLILFDPS
jgi:succinate dehydrogenase / fumarate reductase cytochrome b subunit